MKDFKLKKLPKRGQMSELLQAMDLLSHHLFGFFVLVIFTSILLSLPLTLMYLSKGMGDLGHVLNKNAQITVYLNPELSDAQTLALTDTLNSRPDTQVLRFISAEEGLQEFERQSGIEKLNDYINTNPLPAVLMLKVMTPNPSIDQLNQLSAALQSLPGIESVAMNVQWLEHALKAMASIRTSLGVATGISFFLSLVLIVVLLNFLLPESLEDTAHLTMVYLGVLLGVITGIIADYWVSYFAHLLNALVSQLSFLNVKSDHFHLATSDILVNQLGCWATLIFAALTVRHYRLHMKK